MPRDTTSTRALRSFGAWALACLLVVTPLAVGGMRWDVQLVTAAAALVLLMLGMYARLGRGVRIPWALWLAILLIPLGLLQLVPLSVDTLTALSPKAAELRRFSLGDLGLYEGHRHPISLAPAATWIAVFHQAAFVAVAILAANLERAHRHIVVKALAYGGALVALIGLVHWALEAEHIFGLYAPVHTTRLSGYFATFVNENTQAGYLVLCTLASLGLLSRSDNDGEQRVLLLAAALCATGAVLSGSRGGHTALLIGLVLFAGLAHASQRMIEARRRRARALANVALLLGALALVGAIAVVPEWSSALDERAEEVSVGMWASASKMAADFWATGSGRGSFANVFPVFRDLQVGGLASHPENIGLQLATEWGAIVAIIVLLVAVVGWFHAFTGIGRKVDPVHWGLVAGLAAVGAQQFFDFGFESVSLSLPVAAAFGIVLAGCERRIGPLGKPTRHVAAVVLLAALALGGAVAWKGPDALAAHPDSTRAAVEKASSEALTEVARAAAVAYPADHRVALTTARQLVTHRTGSLRDVMRWINRALFLYPAGGRTHLFAARVLHSAGMRSQSATEFRLAMQLQPWRERPLVGEVARRFDDPDRLARSITRRPRTRLWLGNTLLADRRYELAQSTMDRILETQPNDVEAHLIRARACLKLRADPCAASEAIWLSNHGEAASGSAFQSMLAARAGDPDGARTALEAGAVAGRDDAGFQRAAANVYGQLGDYDAARTAAGRLWKLVGATPRSGASALALRARLEAKAGDDDAASRAYERAYALDTKPRYAAHAVRLAARAGRVADARTMLEKARKRAPHAPELRDLDKVVEKRGTAPPALD